MTRRRRVLASSGYVATPPDTVTFETPRVRRKWDSLVTGYLFGRKALALVLLLIDSRRESMENDLEVRSLRRLHANNTLREVVVDVCRQHIRFASLPQMRGRRAEKWMRSTSEPMCSGWARSYWRSSPASPRICRKKATCSRRRSAAI